MNTPAKTRKLVAQYLKEQTDGFQVKESGDSCYIVTPCVRADGHSIEIEVQHLDGGLVRFTDSGKTLAEIRKGWVSSPHLFSLEEIWRLAGSFGVKLSYDELTLTNEGDGGTRQLQNIISGIIAVSGLIESRREIVQTDKTPSGNAGESILEMFDRILKSHPEPDGYEPPPSDFAKNYKHYLYGFPKEED